MGGKDSAIGPGRFTGEVRKEIIHRHLYDNRVDLPSGEMSQNFFSDIEEDDDSIDDHEAEEEEASSPKMKKI